MKLKCEVCGLGPADGVTVFRQNETGVPGVWRCAPHTHVEIDPGVGDLVTTLERDKRDKVKP